MISGLIVTALALVARASENFPTTTPAPRLNRLMCGIGPPSEELLATLQELGKEEKLSKRDFNNTTTPVKIDVYVNIITRGANDQNNITDQSLDGAVQILNKDYKDAQVSFNLKKTNRVVNAAWARRKNETTMRKSLRQGDKSALNLYFMELVSDPRGVVIGEATFPDDMLGEDGLSQDGVYFAHDTLPGRTIFNETWHNIFSHEIGHWLGLLHTFHGGCDGMGDAIDDTPPEARSSGDCQPHDTCPNQIGVDSVDNHMNYGLNTNCITKFTPNQLTRIHTLWGRFRDVAGGFTPTSKKFGKFQEPSQPGSKECQGNKADSEECLGTTAWCDLKANGDTKAAEACKDSRSPPPKKWQEKCLEVALPVYQECRSQKPQQCNDQVINDVGKACAKQQLKWTKCMEVFKPLLQLCKSDSCQADVSIKTKWACKS
ncbi:hypothetical protein QQS21_003380 [Conoideocrella luteorostrata]|uniref:Peptidase M43 pregnancy-associated plasma-A domain-containing protein n=1 Tax=Conoideocrella luteorostrata TaxID=1105319 RepID=A0AAJ0CTC6_9HYPO|nr:hypothetical protein QQS21_003380 [Conoideocrella luteorostrata]